MPAYEADKVVVSLVADNAQFDAANKASAAKFSQSTAQIEKAASSAEVVLNNLKRKMADALNVGDTTKANGLAAQIAKIEGAMGAATRATGNNRIAMMEWQHIGRGMADQLAAGSSLTQAFASHIGMVSQAMSFSAQSTGKTQGAFAKFAGFLGSGWGIAATFALVGIIKLIQAHKSEGDALEEALDKLRKHADATRTSDEADRVWSMTLDGLIDRQKKLNDELGKRLETQSATDRADLQQAQNERDVLQQQLDKERDRLANLQSQRKSALTDPNLLAAGPEAVQETLRQFDKDIAASKAKVDELTKSLENASSRITRGLEVVGKAQADLAGKAKTFGEIMDHNNKVYFDADPAMAGFSQAVYGATAALAKAATDAASAGVGFEDVERKYDGLRAKFKQTGDVKTYTTEIRKLAKALEDAADAAKKAAQQDPVKAFKASVIGAEGTGPNRLGSSASGFGQFMPGTWLGYFNRLFPDKAALSDAAKLAYRNVRSVAEGVIDKATDDYVNVIKKAGQNVTAANLYAVHVLGSGDAAKFFAAAPGAQTSSFLSAEVLRGNPFLRGTKADASAAFAKRIGDSSGAVSSAATAMQQIAEKQVQSDLDFAKRSDDLDAKIIAARDDQLQDELTRLEISEERIRAEQRTLDAAIDADANAKKAAGLDAATVDAQAKLLKEKNDRLADEKIATVDLQRQAEIAKRLHDAADQRYSFEIADLQASEQLATSLQQRRRIELELIDLKYQQKVADLEYLKLQAERNGRQDEANRIQGQIDHLPYEKAADVVGVEMSTMGPLQSFLKSIPRDADAVNEAFQGIATDGLRSLVDGLGQASVAWIKMGGLAGQVIKELISKIITLILYQQIAKLFGGGGITNPFGSNIVNLGPDISLAPTPAPLDLPGLAGGGTGIIGGFGGTDNNLLSLNGQPVAWVSRGENLSISNDRAAVVGSGGDTYISMPIYANDAVLASTVRGWVREGVAVAIQGGSEGGASLARGRLATRQLHMLD